VGPVLVTVIKSTADTMSPKGPCGKDLVPSEKLLRGGRPFGVGLVGELQVIGGMTLKETM
jgi:hypothetical protein